MPRVGLSGDAAIQHDILIRSSIEVRELWLDEGLEAGGLGGFEGEWVVDGLLGTGLSRPVEGAMRMAIELMNESGRSILALDVPSGLDVDTGRPLGVAVRARATATFGAMKLGFGEASAAEYLGEVFLIELGTPEAVMKRITDERMKGD
jgi:NAD(P)H-hydrate epimerase